MGRLFAALVFVILIAGVGWFALPRFFLPPEVAVAKITRGPAVEAVYATAVVEPVNWSGVAPLHTGRVTEVAVREGDAVKAGDLLARMDDSDLQAQLAEAQSLESFQKTELDRATKLLKEGHIPKDQYDARESALAQTQAHIRTHEEQIRQLSLFAPMDGTVLWRDIEPGEVAEAGREIFWVGSPRPLRLEAEVDEKDIPRIAAGQKVLITADAFPGQVMQGNIASISPKGDPVNKSYRVYASLSDDTKLMIGMTVETNTVVQEKQNALLVPSEAIVTYDGKTYVWKAATDSDGSIALLAPVKTGIAGGQMTEISTEFDEVREGDSVILSLPPDGLLDGAKIRIGAGK